MEVEDKKTLKQVLTEIADVIREKKGYTGDLYRDLSPLEFNAELFLIGKDTLASSMIDANGRGKNILERLIIGEKNGLGVNEVGTSAFTAVNTLKEVVFEEGVKSIGTRAFERCDNIEKCILPASVDSIGTSPFMSCGKLSLISVDSNNKTYDSRGDCNAIIKTETNTLIQGCSASKIPEGVTSIATNAFYGIPISGEVVLPKSLIVLDISAFYSSTIEEINIPDAITTIPSGCFRMCTKLQQIEIGEESSLTSIAGTAFYGCENLESIFIPNGVKTIGDNVFAGCVLMREVIFQNESQLTSIGASAFRTCKSLSSIIIPASVTTIGDDAFSGCMFVIDNFRNNSGLTSDNYWGATFVDEEHNGVLIDDTIVIYGRPNVITANIPNNATSIADSAFEGRIPLKEVTIADDSNLGTIGKKAFRSSTSLESMTFIGDASNFKSISDEAFYGCSKFNKFDMSKLTGEIPTLGARVFTSCASDLKIYVPIGWRETMTKMTNWSAVANKIVEGEPNA